MAKHSFICNCCVYINKEHEHKLCVECNGQGCKWEPTCKEKYEQDPKEYMERLILGSLKSELEEIFQED